MRHLRLLILIFIALMYVGVNRTVVLAQKKNMRVVFVLLSEPRLPKGEDVVKSFYGDTIGRSEMEKLPVQYVPSPLDRKTKVWRVEIK